MEYTPLLWASIAPWLDGLLGGPSCTTASSTMEIFVPLRQRLCELPSVFLQGYHPAWGAAESAPAFQPFSEALHILPSQDLIDILVEHSHEHIQASAAFKKTQHRHERACKRQGSDKGVAIPGKVH